MATQSDAEWEELKRKKFMEKSVASASAFNAHLAERRRENLVAFSLHTRMRFVPYLRQPHFVEPKPSQYPVALMPGQFQDYLPDVLDIVRDAMPKLQQPAAQQHYGYGTPMAAGNTNTPTPQRTPAPSPAIMPSNVPKPQPMCGHMMVSGMRCERPVANVGDKCNFHNKPRAERSYLNAPPKPQQSNICGVVRNSGVKCDMRVAAGEICMWHKQNNNFMCGEPVETDEGRPSFCPIQVPVLGGRCYKHPPPPSPETGTKAAAAAPAADATEPDSQHCFKCHKDDAPLLLCVKCRRRGHGKCWKLKPDIFQKALTYDWYCWDDKICGKCEDPGDEDNLLICDSCDRGFHTYCATPKLDSPPKGKWLCHHCK